MEEPAGLSLHPTPEAASRTRELLNREQLRIPLSAQVLIFGAILIAIIALHFPLLRLPYIWDEAGYYVPAAHDLFLSGSLIPHSTMSNAHPPLVMVWLAAFWKVAGFRPVVTRVAMLAIAAFTLLGVFRLAAMVANLEVAVASTICTALYPVFFMQSSLAHLDMAAAGLTLWGLRSYLARHRCAIVIWFSLAGLAKETAIVAPLTLAGWEIVGRCIHWPARLGVVQQHAKHQTAALVFPVVPLGIWFAYHYMRTGYVFGNPEFFRYNVTATLHPVRMVLAAGLRSWQLLGYMHMWLLTIAAALAMALPPLRNVEGERPRIALWVQAVFLVLTVSYVLLMATIGGAVLPRYMLPVLPLIMILFVSTLWRRAPYWQFVVAIVGVAFVAAWFVNPPYGFPFEDNLAYRDYIFLHEDAERFLVRHRPGTRVLTAWPASDELARPYLGYVNTAVPVVEIDDFSLEQIASAADARSRFDVALIFSTKYEPAHSLLEGWKTWEKIKERYFGFHHDLPAAAAAQVLGGSVIYEETRKGQWIAVVDIQHVVDARVSTAGLRSRLPVSDRNASSRSARCRFPGASEAHRERRASVVPASLPRS